MNFFFSPRGHLTEAVGDGPLVLTR